MNRALVVGLAAVFSTAISACEPPPKMRVTPVARVGDEIVVRFDPPLANRASRQYWIALQRADAPLSSTEGRMILERGDRFVVLRATSPGESEVRLYSDYPKEDHHLVARAPVMVLYRATPSTGPAVD